MSWNCVVNQGNGSCYGSMNNDPPGGCYPCDTTIDDPASIGGGGGGVIHADISKTRGVPSQGSTTTGPRGGSMEQFTEFKNMSGCGLWMCGD